MGTGGQEERAREVRRSGHGRSGGADTGGQKERARTAVGSIKGAREAGILDCSVRNRDTSGCAGIPTSSATTPIRVPPGRR